MTEKSWVDGEEIRYLLSKFAEFSYLLNSFYMGFNFSKQRYWKFFQFQSFYPVLRFPIEFGKSQSCLAVPYFSSLQGKKPEKEAKIDDLNMDFWSNVHDLIGQTFNTFVGCRHWPVDLSVPTILPPRVWVPTTPSTLLSFIVKFALYIFVMWQELKEAQVW